jgi:hypothetical protein
LGNSATVGAGAGVTELARQDNSIKYSGKTGDVNYAAMYKFGNVAGKTSAGSAYSFQLGYEKDAFGIQAAYMGATDALTVLTSVTTSPPTTTFVNLNTNAFLVAAKYKFNDALTGNVGYQRYTLSNPSDADTTTTGALAANYSGAGSTTLVVNNRSTGSASVTVSDIGGNYKFSDKLALYVGYYSINYDAAAFSPDGQVAGGSNAGANSAVNETYVSFLLDYNLSKRTDVYFGGMQTMNNGAGYKGTYQYSGITSVSAGLRTKF